MAHSISANFIFQTNGHEIEGEGLRLLIDNMMSIPDVIRDASQEPATLIYGADRQPAWANIIAA